MGNRKIKSRKQKLYNMIGCSLGKCVKCSNQSHKCNCSCHKKTKGTRRHRKGGQVAPLAYTGSKSFNEGPNPYLAYNGTGGGNINLSYPNGALPVLPINHEFFPGVSQPQNLRGGGFSQIHHASIYGSNATLGGKRRHKRGGNSGKWPDGLTGSPWGHNVSQWPGVDGISGDRNFLAYNNYKYDPQTQGVINSRTLSGGKTRKLKHKLRGGGFIPQDLVNMGRQVMFGLGSTYNALTGYPAPVNPLPYKDQIPNNPSLNTLQYYRK